MNDHYTDGGLRPDDGWYHARCVCGWTEGPFPDLETMVDALMDHAYTAALSSQPTPTEEER